MRKTIILKGGAFLTEKSCLICEVILDLNCCYFTKRNVSYKESFLIGQKAYRYNYIIFIF